MNLKKKVVLRILEQSGAPLSLKQIRHRLGVKKQQLAKLKALLDVLILKGKLEQVGGEFLLASKRSCASQSPPSLHKKAHANKSILPGLKGIFSKTPRGFGFVSMAKGQDVYISRRDRHGALDGDRVEVVLTGSRRPGQRKGKIVGIVEKKPRSFLARLVRGKRMTLALPINKNSELPPVVISPQDDLAEARSGDLISGILVPALAHSKDIFGKILKVLPAQTVDELAFDLILTENQIATEFSEEACRTAENLPQRVLFHAESGRVDLRALGFVTIDGKNARDFDDAVYVEKQDSGTFRLFVAIADVAHYVRPNCPIDQEAYQRGTSVYFPTHAIPMLPDILSNHLCSLRPGVNRLTLTCEMEINAEGQVRDFSIYESLIRSQARLTYEEVAAFLEGNPPNIRSNKIRDSLRIMYELSELLARKRYKRGAIDFIFPEFRVELNETGEIVGFRKEFQSVSMRIIEQFMLEANESVAQHCLRYDLPGLYRVHDKPDKFKMEKLQNTFWRLGLSDKAVSFRNSQKINQFLRKLKGHPHRHQIQLMLLKSMALASYRTGNKGHYGLAAKHYTHFTSPIRRYPDLIVQRALKTKLRADRMGKPYHGKTVPPEVAEHLSQQERKAELAERQSYELIKTIFLERYLGQFLEAQVVAVHSAGLTTELTDHRIECFVPMKALHDDYYHYDERRLLLYGQNSNRLVQAGTLLQLQMTRADQVQRTIEFRLERWLDEPALKPVVVETHQR